MARIQCDHTYEDIISLENLLGAWREFTRGKKNRKDAQEFEARLMGNIIILHTELTQQAYSHQGYEAFIITDPKARHATVRDRVLHRALYRKLYPFFDRMFIADSYSCRNAKGTHRALRRFETYARRISRNTTKTCWVLKCDVQKFFASIDHSILQGILSLYIQDQDLLQLLTRIIESFHAGTPGKGLPLGNLTSQLFVNIYMNEFDHYVKHAIRARQYIRYADDFVVLSSDKEELYASLHYIRAFLRDALGLRLHPRKVSLRTLSSGIDFLGWVHFPAYRTPRTSMIRRMKRQLRSHVTIETVQSYYGLLGHGNAHNLQQQLVDEWEILGKNEE